MINLIYSGFHFQQWLIVNVRSNVPGLGQWRLAYCLWSMSVSHGRGRHMAFADTINDIDNGKT